MMSKWKSRPFNMRMPEDLREILVAAAEREDRSLANFMIRAALTAAEQGPVSPLNPTESSRV